MKKKKCNGCLKLLPLDNFGKKPTGHANGRCRPCLQAYRLERERLREAAKTGDGLTIMQRYWKRRNAA